MAGALALLLWPKTSRAASSGASSSAVLMLLSRHPDLGYIAEDIVDVSVQKNVNPLLTAAIILTESQGGKTLSPVGPGGKGDNGHGHGLMQIDDRTWGSWLAVNQWWIPRINIAKGLDILKSGTSFFGGTRGRIDKVTATGSDGAPMVFFNAARMDKFGVNPAFRLLPGPGALVPDPRPLAGERLLRASLAAYNTGLGNVLWALAAGKNVDFTTAKSRYSATVMENLSELKAMMARGG